MGESRSKRATVPKEILANVRSLCLALPETVEEAAWAGTRWCVRKKNFAHVLMIEDGWPPAYAKAAGRDGPACVLTFRSGLAEFDPGMFTHDPFFRPRWWPDIVGVVLNEETDWEEAGDLIAASYCHLAPKKLARLVRRA